MTKKRTIKTVKPPKNLVFSVIATDVVLWAIHDSSLWIRLIPVNIPGFFRDMQGLPGGLILPEETAEQAAKRLIKVKAGIAPHKVHLEQLYTFSEVNRDPRGRVVAVAYSGYVAWEELSISEREGNEVAIWVDLKKVSRLAYDHNEIIKTAIERLQSRVGYTNLISKLMPKKFTLTELQQAYEIILGTELDKRNFRKKLLGQDLLTELTEKRTGGKHRPAKLYTFKSSHVTEAPML